MIFIKPTQKKSTMLTTQAEENYYTQASQWRYQIYESQTVWLTRSLIALGVISLMLILSLLSNLFLFPLKQTVPFLYTVNEKTGELTQIGEFKPESFKENWLMTRFLIIRYIVNRESYDADNLERPYQITWAMSDDKIAKDYANAVRTDNLSSPYAIYGKSKFIHGDVLSINQLNENTAEVRFEQTLNDRNTETKQSIQKAAILKWQYATPITTQKMLDRDPLGFKVIYYQATQTNLNNH